MVPSPSTIRAASDYWIRLQQRTRVNDIVHRVLWGADFSYLRKRALEIRRKADQNAPDSLTCTIDEDKFANGTFNVAFEIKFSDSIRWIARIKLQQGDRDVAKHSMLNEIGVMRYVKSKTTIPVPEVYDFDTNSDNPLGFAYMLMETLPGRTFKKDFPVSIPPEYWTNFTTQLADYYHQLSCLRFDQIGIVNFEWDAEKEQFEEPTIGPSLHRGEGPFVTSLEYLQAQREREEDIVKRECRDDEQWEVAMWIHRQALPFATSEKTLHGPFPLCHMDLYPRNVLVDENYHITGIIDWAGAQAVPVECFIYSAEHFQSLGLSTKQQHLHTMYRKKFASALREFELARNKPLDNVPNTQLSDLLGTALHDIAFRSVYRGDCTTYTGSLQTAGLLLYQLYGPKAKWHSFVRLYHKSKAGDEHVAEGLVEMFLYAWEFSKRNTAGLVEARGLEVLKMRKVMCLEDGRGRRVW
jgi:serine/threonine protein kinase